MGSGVLWPSNTHRAFCVKSIFTSHTRCPVTLYQPSWCRLFFFKHLKSNTHVEHFFRKHVHPNGVFIPFVLFLCMMDILRNLDPILVCSFFLASRQQLPRSHPFFVGCGVPTNRMLAALESPLLKRIQPSLLGVTVSYRNVSPMIHSRLSNRLVNPIRPLSSLTTFDPSSG